MARDEVLDTDDVLRETIMQDGGHESLLFAQACEAQAGRLAEADQPARLIRFDSESRAGEPTGADGSAADGVLDRGFI